MDHLSSVRRPRGRRRHLADPFTVFVMLGLVVPAPIALMMARDNLFVALALWTGGAIATMAAALAVCSRGD